MTHAETYPAWALIPFVFMLAAIAVFPILPKTASWWEKRSAQLLVALGLGIPTSIWMIWKAGPLSLGTTLVDYVQFICLLFTLFVISGGIHLEGDVEATPRTNTIFIGVGGVLASFIGTTGAAMLLIRPLLETNRERTHRVHTVLFTIFVVANCGGLLTPLGDPPLFLGFLHGVPFTWTLVLWKEWAFVLALLLFIYFSLDSLYYAQEPISARQKDRAHVTPLRLRGMLNIALFVVVIVAVAFIPSLDAHAVGAGQAHGWELVPFREIVMLVAAFLSLRFGDQAVRAENQFTWAPIAEVAALFIGIFTTMAPALRYLEQVAPSLPLNRTTFFIFTGGLSSVLDNAPTYLTFFEMAQNTGAEVSGPIIAGVPEYFLVPIALGAVMCGAITYIGNGPNFMVKSVAESQGVAMPSFGRYIVDAVIMLVPVLAAMALIFVVPGIWATAAGLALTAVIIGVAARRIIVARGTSIGLT